MKHLIIIEAIVLVGLVIFAGYVLNYGFDKQEKVDCNRLQSMEQYPDFYITQSEKEMCDRWNIEIDAPVKNLLKF